jgi:hypothetical protein
MRLEDLIALIENLPGTRKRMKRSKLTSSVWGLGPYSIRR